MSTTAERANEYLRQETARVVAPPPNADTVRAEYYSRQCARLGEQLRGEARRADRWRTTALYAFGAAIFFLGALRGADWILALGVVLVVWTVLFQNGREWQ